jgi:hypothetical protein
MWFVCLLVCLSDWINTFVSLVAPLSDNVCLCVFLRLSVYVLTIVTWIFANRLTFSSMYTAYGLDLKT